MKHFRLALLLKKVCSNQKTSTTSKKLSKLTPKPFSTQLDKNTKKNEKFPSNPKTSAPTAISFCANKKRRSKSLTEPQLKSCPSQALSHQSSTKALSCFWLRHPTACWSPPNYPWWPRSKSQKNTNHSPQPKSNKSSQMRQPKLLNLSRTVECRGRLVRSASYCFISTCFSKIRSHLKWNSTLNSLKL